MITTLYFIIGFILAIPVVWDDAPIQERVPAALIVFFGWGLLVLLYLAYRLFKFAYEAKRKWKRQQKISNSQ